MGQSSSNSCSTLIESCNWQSFLDAVQELNRKNRKLLTENDEYICFALRRKDMKLKNHKTWKNDIQIICCKVNIKTNAVLLCKKISLNEFWNIYDVHQLLKEEKKENANPMTSSQYVFDQTSDDEGHCVICMEAKNETLLPCLHSFCLTCIAAEFEYRGRNFSCPVCRKPIADPIEQSWEVPDLPEEDEVNQYLKNIAQ